MTAPDVLPAEPAATAEPPTRLPPLVEPPDEPTSHLAPIPEEAVPGARTWSGLTYAVVHGHRPLTLDLHVPEGVSDPPLVVWVHGGRWLAGDRRRPPAHWPEPGIFAQLVAAGMAVATLDYRLLGEAPFPACVHDVHAALRYLHRYAAALGVDASRLGIWGESAGAHLACLTAFASARAAHGELLDGVDLAGVDGVRGPQPLPVALVSWYAPDTSVHQLLADRGGVGAFAPPRVVPALLPASQVSRWAPPTLVAHGAQDGTVPVEDAHRIHATLVDAGVEARLSIVPGADHGFVGQPVGPILEESIAFLASHLRPGASV